MLFAEQTTEVAHSGRSHQGDTGVASLLRAYRYHVHRPSSPQALGEFVERFSAAWRKHSQDSAPQPTAVLEMMHKRDRVLKQAWTQLLPGDYPPVMIASVLECANPFIVRASGMSPLIVMSEGLAAFAFGMVLTAMLYAHEEHDSQECLTAMRQFMLAWLENDPALAPAGALIQDLSTLDQETTTFAVGLSNSVLTWAFYHELGHFRLGHLGHRTQLLHATPGGEALAELRSYSHQLELDADAFGMDRYLELLMHEAELRRNFEIGRQADHAPIMGFELMNLAYRLHPQFDRRGSQSHPAPLDRAAGLHKHAAARLSAEGREFYAYWSDLLAHVEAGLTSH